MNRPINFNAGPAAIPIAVLDIIHRDLFNWKNTGLSILETGHRSAEFTELGEQLEASVRRILQVPEHFSVLFLPGGGQIQFAMTAMNLSRGFKKANYIETGYWSSMAMKEAQKITQVHLAASSQLDYFATIPNIESWDIMQDAAYLHFTDNETIGGLEFSHAPEIDNMVLVSDMSSNIFSRPIDFKRMGCVYACAQKNLGIAGMSLVIIRRDLLDRALPETPAVFHYETQDKSHSLLATPTTFAWYVALLILDWIEQEGGVIAMAKRSAEKSQQLYSYIDGSGFYQNNIDPRYRSRMNIPFTLSHTEYEKTFFQEAKELGLVNLEGHRSVGGARASLYNAINLDDVKILIDFLANFAKKQRGRA